MSDTRQMQLVIVLPTEELVNVAVNKVTADAANGSFCLLPRHIDFVAALVPGVLCYWDLSGRECFVGLDQGVLVKCGKAVSVSAVNGVCGTDLGELRGRMQARSQALEEQERKARAALARLELSTLKGFWESREQLSE